ncbi:adenylyltransferase/cytidyltransferase family protein [Candidatus Riesia pediculischaeffi]|uniref:adenylyltransferase/cytidyltransferase family protein n=1 Tax=Candidatus Riesia pediculischaeffi TaxID=428411 RepID=UPI002A4E15E7|nr:adenylyltransferase/cytidyltransferase family protein [Candidatus Riesia pediculischaeffi]
MKETLNICKLLNEKIVMIDGFFDEIHFSCIRFLDKARSLGDRLIVAINSDISVEKLAMKSSIVYSLEERMEVLSKLKSVDWIIPFDEKTPEDLVREIKPDIFVKTDDRYLRDISWINNILCDVGEVRVI